MLPSQPLNQEAVRSLFQAFPTLPHPTQANTRWAQLAGLLDGQTLTPEGKLVLEKDPFLESTVTAWLLHCNLSENDPNWHYFIHQFLPKNTSFSVDAASQDSAAAFGEMPSDKTKKTVQVILKTYEGAIAKTHLITKAGKSYSLGKPDLSNPFTTGYLLAKAWEKHRPDQHSILVDDVLSPEFGLIQTLGISAEDLRIQLDNLAKHEILEKRSARPHALGKKPFRTDKEDAAYQIFPGWQNTLELLEKAFGQDIATPNRPLTQSLAAILDDEDDSLDISALFEWASEISVFEGGSKMMISFAS